MYHQLPEFTNVYVVGDCAALPYAPSAQVAEEQAEQIVKVLRLVWNGEPLPETMPEIKLKGSLVPLGRSKDLPILQIGLYRTYRAPVEIGSLWMYKWHNG